MTYYGWGEIYAGNMPLVHQTISRKLLTQSNAREEAGFCTWIQKSENYKPVGKTPQRRNGRDM